MLRKTNMAIITVNCPHCQAQVLDEHFDLTTDLAHCLKCGQVFHLSEQIWEDWEDGFHFKTVPKGIGFSHTNGHQVEIRIKGRNIQFKIFGVILALINIIMAVPVILFGIFDQGESIVRPVFFLVILLIVLATFFLIGFAMAFGKEVLALRADGGIVILQLGPMNYRRVFSWDEIDSIKEEKTFRMKQKDTKDFGIGMEYIVMAGKGLAFGNSFSPDQRFFILKYLQAFKKSTELNQPLPGLELGSAGQGIHGIEQAG